MLLLVVLGCLNFVLLVGLVATHSGVFLLRPLGCVAGAVIAVICGWCSVKYWKSVKGLFLFGASLLLIGGWLSASLYDYSFDGMRYHQMVVYALSHGWLPWEKWSEFLMRYPGDPSKLLQLNTVADEGFWIGSFHLVAAIVSAISGNHEVGKIYQWLFLWLNFHVAFWVLGKLGLVRARRWIFTLLLSFNPITVYQLFSYAQDGAMSSLLISLLLLLYLSVREEKINGVTSLLYLGISFLLLWQNFRYRLCWTWFGALSVALLFSNGLEHVEDSSLWFRWRSLPI